MNIDIHSYLTRDGLHKARIQYVTPNGNSVRQYTANYPSSAPLFIALGSIVARIHTEFDQPYKDETPFE